MGWGVDSVFNVLPIAILFKTYADVIEDIKWTEHENEVTSSCYKVLATLRKIKNTTPQETEKSLGKSLELSKLNFNYYVAYPLPTFLQKRVQCVQNACWWFCLESFLFRKGRSWAWLATYTRKYTLFSEAWPEYLQLPRHNPQWHYALVMRL